MQKASEVLVFLLCVSHIVPQVRLNTTHVVELHELLAVHLLGLIQRNELNLLWWESFICEGTLDRCLLLATSTDCVQYNTYCRDRVSLLRPRSAGEPDSRGACPAAQ